MPAGNRIIVLVGLMGSGKTRIGIELAKILKLPFIDVDREIELAANFTITEIFDRFGEAEFRRGEREIISRLLNGEPKIIASGGGAFIQPSIRQLIKDKAISIWLRAELQTLIDRTSHTNHRPLLRVSNPQERLKQLMTDRYPIYAEADITVTTDNQTPQSTARLIINALYK